MDPVEHYLSISAQLGRNPGLQFDTRFYLDVNYDVARQASTRSFIMSGGPEGGSH